MRYLITGGAGFIGSHLADALLAEGHTVHAFDNLSTGRLTNIEHLAHHDRFRLTVGNVLDAHTLERCIEACDCVVHLAAAVGVRRVIDQPVETILTNVRGTENVLQLARYHGAKVALASTSEIYGKAMQKDTSLERLSETDDWTLGAPSKRRWGYACSKAMDEFLAHAYADEYGLSMIALRFFNTVGPRQSGRYGMVVPNFVSQALAGEDIRVFGDGEQTRCFTHVADAVRAVTDLLDAPGVEGGAYNIGTTEETSINALAERARTLAGSTSEIVHVPYEEAYGPGFEDMRRRTPDLQKLRDTTGYVPQKSLDDILNDVISHMRRSHGATHKDREAASADLNAFSS